MEISTGLKCEIKSIQGEMTRAIKNHQDLVVKLKEFPELECQIKRDLSRIQKLIIELNDKQKVLLQQLRKEIEDNMNNNHFVPVFNFNLYKIKPGQLESKKRRRKDLSLAPKVVACRPAHSPPSLSPSPTPISSSSLSDDSIEYLSPFMLPVPVPKPRPMLLPDVKENHYMGSVSRRDLRPPKLKRNQKLLSDEEVFKDIPVYYDPIPSPPPTDEKDLKARFMTALSLIPKEMLNDILNRKVERKRRSTATNNPNFVYNNDWEIPAWKRSRTYLSPHKIGKIDVSGKKIKGEDGMDGGAGALSSKPGRKEKEGDGRLYLDGSGFGGEKTEVKSRNSTPDSTSSGMLCFVCHTSGPLQVCKDCSVCFHSSCVSPNSSISCPCCKNKRSSADDVSSEDSSKEEFVSKCPNVAESYTKLKEYIENHTDSDTAALYSERENFKMELMSKNQELYSQKRELEEKASELSEALLLQEDRKNQLLQEEEKILEKIKIFVDFITIYQKTNKCAEAEGSSDSVKASESTKEEKSKEGKGDREVPTDKTEGIDENEGENREGEEWESPGSWKETCSNSQTNYFSPERNSPMETFDSSSQTSKESVGVGELTSYNCPQVSSKDKDEVNVAFEESGRDLDEEEEDEEEDDEEDAVEDENGDEDDDDDDDDEDVGEEEEVVEEVVEEEGQGDDEEGSQSEDPLASQGSLPSEGIPEYESSVE